jgi:hypothetical protein
MPSARRLVAGFAVTGTLGLLDRAARRRLIDFKEAVTRLRVTSFHVNPAQSAKEPGGGPPHLPKREPVSMTLVIRSVCVALSRKVCR